MLKKVVSLALAAALATTMVTPLSAIAAPDEPETVAQPPLTMWYDAPATDWESEANPLGNGFLGAMVFGGVDSDQILINEHTLWSGGPGANPDYDGGFSDATTEENVANLKKAQELLQEAVTDFTENNSAYIDPDTGNVVSSNYNISSEINNLINTLKGDKSNFGHYQQLSNVMITNGPETQILPIAITSNSANAESDNQQYQEGPEKAFDGSIDSKWYSVGGLSGGSTQEWPAWVTAEYAEPLATSQYAIVSGNDSPGRDPKNWTLYGSNDGKIFEVIDTREDVTFDGRKETKTFDLGREVTYKYYKFEVSEIAGNDGGVQMQEIILDYAAEKSSDYSNYRRSLDLDNAVANVQYTLDGVNYNREYFVSNPDNMIVVRLTADQPGSISKYFYIDTPQTKSTITAEGDTITMVGQPSDQNEDGLHFAQQVKVIPTNGSMEVVDNGIMVNGADEVLILTTAGTNYQQCMDDSFDYFTDEDPLDAVSARIAASLEKGYDQLKADHIADYKSLYDNVKLNLGTLTVPDKPTDQLLAGYSGRTNNPNTAEEDLYLETMYYQFGRYLLISSSREGSLPANLQGIWASGLTPPWDADYHTNINLQMNYWLAEQTNLTECHEPMITYINSLVPRGQITAQKVFGEDTRGWTTFHENNIWGNTAPAVSDAFWTPTAAGWLVQDIWEVYAFNMDEEFLADNYDTMLQSALFLLDILVEDTRDGSLVISPSYSPEHGPYSLGSTFDQAVVWDVFNNVILASDVLGKSDDSEVQEIKAAFEKLSGPQIGLAGQFQEWKDETTMDITGDGGHRHVNHLYGLHPGKQIVAGRSEEDDAYVEAMKNTLNTRGDGGTGWSKAWKVNFWARLRDGDHSHKMLEELLKESTLDNLFDTHSPFQIDGNFGGTAGMNEMLIQSQGDSIDLLAAMPSKWDTGSVTGVRARGNVEVDMTWRRATLTGATLKTGTTTDDLKVRGENIAHSTLTDSNGNPVDYTVIDDNTITFDVVAGETYSISDIRNEEGVAQAREELTNLIASAKEELAAKTPDGDIYDETANKALETAIETAQAVLDSDTQDFFELSDAVGALQTAIAEFEDAYNVEISVSLESGIYSGATTVKVECASHIVDIRYTLDGSEPTLDSPKYYNGILMPNGISTLKVASFLNGEQINETITREYMINGSNLALNKTATTVDTAVISGYGPEKTVDGDLNSRLATNGGSATIEINFGSETTLDSLVIHQFVEQDQTTRINSYTMEYWNGSEWVTCDTYDGTKTDNNIIFNNDPDNNPTQYAEIGSTFEPITTSRIRINTSGSEVSIWEIEAFNSQTAIDKTALNQAIMDANSIELDGYTEASIAALQTALTAAQAVADNSQATQEEINNATTALRNAINGLTTTPVEEANKTNLKFYLDKANSVDSSVIESLVESAQTQFTTALENGRKVYDDAAATQEEVNAATKELRIALNMLSMVAGDKEALIDLITEAEDLIGNADSNYPQSAIDALQDAIDAAQIVVDDGDAFQVDVDKAVNDLQDAIEAFNNSKLDWRALDAAVADAANIKADKDSYVNDETAWKAFDTAYEVAQNVLESKTADGQEAIDKVTTALLEASSNLRYKADKDTLTAVIADAESVDVSLYTAMSVANFKAALAAANTVATDESLSTDDQAVVDNAAVALEDAMAALVPVDTAVAGGGEDTTATAISTKTGDVTSLPIALIVVALAVGAGSAFRKKRSK